MNKDILIETSIHLIQRESEFQFENIETELYEMGEHKEEEIEYILDTIYKLLGGKYYIYALNQNITKKGNK